jgi:hypothetical protein
MAVKEGPDKAVVDGLNQACRGIGETGQDRPEIRQQALGVRPELEVFDSGDIHVTDTAARAVLAPVGSHDFLDLIDDVVGFS